MGLVQPDRKSAGDRLGCISVAGVCTTARRVLDKMDSVT